MVREDITQNAIWFHPQCTLDGIVYVCVWTVSIWGGYSETEKSQSAKICLKLNFPCGGGGGGGVGGYSETEKSQSAKICLKLNFPCGGVFWNWKVTKCQDLPKVEFYLGGDSETEKSQSAKICLKLNFTWGGGYSETVLENRGIL